MSKKRNLKFDNGVYRAGTYIYDIWRRIQSRCNNPNSDCFVNYGARGVKVCEEWEDFQKFAKWYEANQVRGWHLDKDILGGSIYSPETCLFVPMEINQLLTDSRAIRGQYPVGVYFEKESGKYKAQCSYLENSVKKRKNLGRFSTPEMASEAYKKFKKSWIKRQAGLHCISSGMSGKALINLLKIGDSL